MTRQKGRFSNKKGGKPKAYPSGGRPIRGGAAVTARPQHRPSTGGGAPSPEKMDALLRRSGITLDSTALKCLWAYHNLLRSHNHDRDLTRIVGFEPMVLKHYADCLWVTRLTDLPASVLDVGTGAGFPGIPLKIQNPGVRFVLAEPRPKRVEFLRMVIQKLSLPQATVFEHRVVSRSFQEPVDGVITRALETMDKTFLRTSGATRPGSKLIFMKGPNADDEIRDVQKRFKRFLKLVQDEKYTIPHTPHERRLVVWERTEEALPSSAANTEIEESEGCGD